MLKTIYGRPPNTLMNDDANLTLRNPLGETFNFICLLKEEMSKYAVNKLPKHFH